MQPEPKRAAPSPEKALPLWYLHNPGMQSCHGKKPISDLLGASMHAVRNQHCSHLKVNSPSLGVNGLPSTSTPPSALPRGLLTAGWRSDPPCSYTREQPQPINQHPHTPGQHSHYRMESPWDPSPGRNISALPAAEIHILRGRMTFGV